MSRKLKSPNSFIPQELRHRKPCKALEPPYNVDDSVHIEVELANHHDGNFGFAIYRCVYGDEEAWKHFVERMIAHAHARLDSTETGRQIKDRFAWDIMDDKEKLDGASKEQVRGLFKHWRDAVRGRPILPRYGNCIYADQEVIDSVLNGDAPGSTSPQDRNHPTAFVKVLDDMFEEQPEQLTPDDESDDEEREKLNAGDEGYPDIEGCKRKRRGLDESRYTQSRAQSL
ncbi:hypothetical protein M409DRAFT_56035 [Zasmidium cellare ATCC 36951]|uniref:Uncharacterized protein n=1 Tax=Zasmidium cellare ATCC 36951 TaxID=1080233 RepID=A0A6A6CHI3_ZASCE|nr:uncharacterized protein M409DRAFT_56035 [Zasmidium cellare ATCC 36951]KAF2165149.1 hypothetical protein M409DRAFT_56035 [Zasmidium cellare ATCC 36951]